MKLISNIFLVAGVLLISIFGYQLWEGKSLQSSSLEEAEALSANGAILRNKFTAEHGKAIATLSIPKLDRTLAIVEGTDADSLKKGIGHLSQSVFPGDNEQIVLSGHRDTVFRNFDQITTGDSFIVDMPYGSYEYEIKETEIVPEDDTTVIRDMGEEVLVVTTCYPFSFVGSAPDRFVAYAYPVKEE